MASAAETTKLFVGGIPTPYASPEQLGELIEQHGVTPVEAVVLPPRGSNPDTRCGFIRVAPGAAEVLIQALNGMRFEGFAVQLVVRVAEDKKSKGSQGGGLAGGGAVDFRVPSEEEPDLGLGSGPSAEAAAWLAVAPPAAGGAPGAEPAAAAEEAEEEGGLAAAMKRRAKEEGKWIEAAEWLEQEHQAAGEGLEAKLQRMTAALSAAALQEHFYEAATIFETLAQLDPERAAAANLAAAAACSAGHQAAPPPRRRPPAPGGAARSALAAARYGPTQVVDLQRVQPKSSAVAAWAAPPQPVAAAWAGPLRGPPAAAAGWAAPAAATAAPGPAPAQPLGLLAAEEANVYSGTIIAFHPERHFGFIGCPELGADAFLSDKQLNGFQCGDAVTFAVTYNAKGQPQAQNLQAASTAMGQPAAGAPHGAGGACAGNAMKRLRMAA